MKRILLNLALLFGMFVLFMAALILPLYLNDTDLPPSEGYYVKDLKRIYDPAADAGVLILGNSRALNSLSAPVIASRTGLTSYQLAIKSADLCTSRLELESYLRHCKKRPAYCLMEVSWFSFNTSRTAFNLDFATDLLLKDPTPLRFTYAHPELVQRLIIKSELDAVSLVRRLATEHTWKLPPEQYRDYQVNLNLKQKPGPFFVKRDLLRYFPNYEAGIDPELAAHFEKILDLCRRNRIKVVLYSAPEYPEYTAAQKDRGMVKQRIVSLARKYGASYFDFTADGAYWRSEFVGQLYDSHHLNNPDRFSAYFAATVFPPAVTGRL